MPAGASRCAAAVVGPPACRTPARSRLDLPTAAVRQLQAWAARSSVPTDVSGQWFGQPGDGQRRLLPWREPSRRPSRPSTASTSVIPAITKTTITTCQGSGIPGMAFISSKWLPGPAWQDSHPIRHYSGCLARLPNLWRNHDVPVKPFRHALSHGRQPGTCTPGPWNQDPLREPAAVRLRLQQEGKCEGTQITPVTTVPALHAVGVDEVAVRMPKTASSGRIWLAGFITMGNAIGPSDAGRARGTSAAQLSQSNLQGPQEGIDVTEGRRRWLAAPLW